MFYDPLALGFAALGENGAHGDADTELRECPEYVEKGRRSTKLTPDCPNPGQSDGWAFNIERIGVAVRAITLQRLQCVGRNVMARKQSGGSGRVLAFVGGFLVALVVLAVGFGGYMRWGHPPVAVSDAAFPFEAKIVHVPLGARIAGEIKQPPFPASEDAYEKGARVYAEDCAFCHGAPGGQDSPYGPAMYPAAPQLWAKHKHGNAVGVSDDPVGESFWKIKNGIRLTGMPEFGDSLSDPEMWDVALLLKAADQPLPDPVMKKLQGETGK
jgi:thiosulfate dehydrogenase